MALATVGRDAIMANGKTSKIVFIGSPSPSFADDWKEHHGNLYRCQVYLYHEKEGGFSVIAASLPGVASQGETEQQALANITEAFAGVISVYEESGGKIPWTDRPREPGPGAVARWVFVNA
jgi:predicted RNase H-like HicB family nuclease